MEKLRGSSMLDWRGHDQRVGYANVHKLAPSNVIPRGPRPGLLQESPRDFSTFTYSLKGTSYGLDHFMTRLNVVGLLVITDGKIVLERYAQGHAADIPWTSWSVAKSVTSMLFGAAIQDGHIKSLDDEVIKYSAGVRRHGATRA